MFTSAISASSSAHPVTGIAPVTPLTLLAGVSMTPNGLAPVPVCITRSVTLIGGAKLPAPVIARVMAP